MILFNHLSSILFYIFQFKLPLFNIKYVFHLIHNNLNNNYNKQKKSSNLPKMDLQQTNLTLGTQTQISVQKHQEAKIQKFILDFNKIGLKLLTQGNFDDAIIHFKRAQKIIIKQISIHQSNCKLIQLLGITYNNLACYYKKTKKPKVALKYLKKALELEVYKLNNWTSIAGTHLNICAIYSFMKNHLEASNHAQLAINFLQKVNFEQQDSSEEAKAYWNVLMLSYYNLAIQKEYLKEYDEAVKCYKKSKEISQLSGKRNVAILIQCDGSIGRLEPLIQNLRKKMIESIKKKQQSDEKGYVGYIRLNKKNFSNKKYNENENNEQDQKRITNYLNRVAIYDETPTNEGIKRFRTRRIGTNSLRQTEQSYFNNRLKSVTSFNKRSNDLKDLNKDRKIRLLTENDVDERKYVNEGLSGQKRREINQIKFGINARGGQRSLGRVRGQERLPQINLKRSSEENQNNEMLSQNEKSNMQNEEEQHFEVDKQAYKSGAYLKNSQKIFKKSKNQNKSFFHR